MLDSSLKSIRDMRAALDEKKISSRELAEEYLKNIRSRDGEIKAYITVTEEGALKQADEAQKLIDDPDKFLSTIQIGITLIGILTGIYSGDALASKFGRELAALGISLRTATVVAQITIVIFVTYLTLIFGELVPKRIGMNSATSPRICR